MPWRKRTRSTEMVRVSVSAANDLRYFRDLVRQTRSTFESLRALLLRVEEGDGGGPPFLGKRSRADLKAAALMTQRGLWLNRDKRIIGSIPGVSVGDIFFFRMELCVIGLHGQVQAGIDHVPASGTPNGEPIATSIIVSGGYEDDEDRGDTIIYTGHGGRGVNIRRQCVDQKLMGGNLALERSMTYGIEVRVIRGLKSDRSPNGKVYVYDGLYKIVKCWLDVGKSGFGVYKYKLLRMENQPEMGSTIIKFAEGLKRDMLQARPVGTLSLDISGGMENFPVSLFNDIDGDRDPLFFEYLARPVYPPYALEQRINGLGGGGCQCVSNCSEGCYCALKNGGELPYDVNGVLLRGKPLIYECGSSCSCPMTCRNRVTQKGVRSRLEVFRSRETGWGVRSLELIRAGTFVCEYSGIVLTRQQSELLAMNGDGLVYPSRFPPRWAEWGDVSRVFPDYIRPMFPFLPQLDFSLDVSRMRNVACYLSHSCAPNVFVQFVLYDHYNVLYPHLMIFAMENIPPLRELSIDYGVGDAWMEPEPAQITAS
ncbi:hypothetical protein Taro_034532 [Colocasia esculenta]|uniref:Uncharacterized protein n=1 Tax=Colocasia esculenta TaxID=4460 RepID=A0A843WC67_COLES|nr:hypothetical protein [Colocasia esculenta]